MKIEAVCFDMDGTLIRNTDSVKYLCMLNNNLVEFEKIDRRQYDGSISWIESDYLKAKLINGLELKEVKKEFKNHIQLIKNIEQVLLCLKKKRIISVLITAGPTQVAKILGTEFGFDRVYGSEYEVKEGKFTGIIKNHLGNEGKLDYLKELCKTNSISLDRCVAIGDSESDTIIFKNCGRSIAINYTDDLKGEASEYIITDDLADIMVVIESWLSE